MKWRDLGFLAAFSAALMPPLAMVLHAHGFSLLAATWVPLLYLFVLIPLLDALAGKATANWSSDNEAQELSDQRAYRFLVMLTLPAWLLLLTWCTARFATMPMGLAGGLGWVLSTGVIGGVLAINPAHELIHKSGRMEPACGGILLASVGYHGFKIEHVRGHHVNVATPEDSSSASLGEAAYVFVPRAIWHNARNAWQLEQKRLEQRNLSVWSWRNEMLCWTALWALFAVAVASVWGLAGLGFFLAQGLVAATTLEIINYVEHYGLQRQRLASGRYERVTHMHSWNAPQRMTNWLLFNLQRHSDHHANARRRYQALLHHDDSPQLPAGYASMLLLALVPPLWRRVMDPRVRRARGAIS